MSKKTKIPWTEPQIVNMEQLATTLGACGAGTSAATGGCDAGSSALGDGGGGQFKCSAGTTAGKNQCNSGSTQT
jgi:hypothetical protein